MKRRQLWAVLPALGILAMPVLATRVATLSGVVTDVDGRSVGRASVTVMGTGKDATTGEDGRYRITGVPAGEYWVLVRHDGFRPNRKSITLTDGARSGFAFQLSPLARGVAEESALSELGMSRSRFHDFMLRTQSAFGEFLTEDELGATSDDVVELVRRYLPGRTRAALERRSTDPGARSPRLLRRSSHTALSQPPASTGCGPAISRNGSPPSLGASLADFDRDQIEALEIYRRGSWQPTELTYRADGSGCGLVVIWLK